MPNLMQRAEIAKDFAQTTVDNTVTTVQNVHTVISDACFNVVNQLPGMAGRLDSLQEKHDAALGQVYDAIRSINRSLGSLASDLFGSVEESAYVAQVMTETDQKDGSGTIPEKSAGQTSAKAGVNGAIDKSDVIKENTTMARKAGKQSVAKAQKPPIPTSSKLAT